MTNPNSNELNSETIDELAEHLKILKGVPVENISSMLEAAQNGDWLHFFYCIQEPFRLEALYSLNKHLSDVEFWRAFRYIWNRAHSLWEDADIIAKIFGIGRNRGSLMDGEEKASLEGSTDPMIIYRGGSATNLQGYSWSLSKETAERFAKIRTEIDGYVITGECRKGDVLFLSLKAGESEIVVFPNMVRITSRMQSNDKRIEPAYCFMKGFWDSNSPFFKSFRALEQIRTDSIMKALVKRSN